MSKKLLNDTEASIHLGITKELLYAYVRYAPKTVLKHDRKLISVEVNGKNMFDENELNSFNAYLKEPWSGDNDKRPEIPSYIQDYLKTEIGGKCPITGKGFPLENAHIIDYSVSKSHHHHNIIRIAKDEHTKFDKGVLSKELLSEIKSKLIKSLTQRIINSPAETTIITFLPNIDIESVKGRQDEINKIYQAIVENKKVTIVNGIGGIGKTSLAQLYSKLYYNDYDYFLWIEFPNLIDNATSREVFISEFANNFLILDFFGIAIDNKIPIEGRFELVLQKLNCLSGKKLIVLDNVPSAFSEFSIRFPKTPGFDVLATSRNVIENFVSVNIDNLNEKDALDLFYSFYPTEKNDKIVLEILRLIGLHTLTIELISKMGFKRELSLQTLYTLIAEDGLKTSLEARVLTKHDKNRIPSTPFDYLCGVFDVSKLRDSNLNLLRSFSVIGNIRLSLSQLEDLLSDGFKDNEFFHNLMELHHLGWITKNENTYVIHQLICEVLRFKLEPTFESCTILTSKVCQYLGKSTNEFDRNIQKTYIEIAEQILNNLKVPKKYSSLSKFLISRYYGNIGNHEKYYEWFSNLEMNTLDSDLKRNVLVNHGNILLNHGKCMEAIKILEESRTSFKDELTKAEIDATIAHAYGELGDFVKAKNIFENAFKILENDVELSRFEYAVFVNNYAHVFNGLGNHSKALEFSLKALKLREELLTENHPLIAQSYNNVGVDYEYLGEIDKAYSFHSRALEIRKGFRDENYAELAESYHNIASIYFQKGNSIKAIDYFEKAINIRENVYPEGSPSLITSYFCYAAFLIEVDIQKSLKIYKKAFSLCDKFDLDNNPHMSHWLMGHSIALFENRDFKESLKYVSLTIGSYEKNGDEKGVEQAIRIKNRILASSSIKKDKKIGRNELCTCGSGKKYKKCCGTN